MPGREREYEAFKARQAQGEAPPAAPPRPRKAPLEYGAETPMPGREREYEAYKSLLAQAGAAGPAAAPPPIDAERRNRSPGLRNNFYDISTADFKRPHGISSPVSPLPPRTRARMHTRTHARTRTTFLHLHPAQLSILSLVGREIFVMFFRPSPETIPPPFACFVNLESSSSFAESKCMARIWGGVYLRQLP